MPEPRTHTSTGGSLSVEKTGGTLVNLILGALILWVGQTTFKHNGLLLSMDERVKWMQDRYDKMWERINEKTQSRYTKEDAGRDLAEYKAQYTTMRQIVERAQIQLSSAMVAIAKHDEQLSSVRCTDNCEQITKVEEWLRNVAADVATHDTQLHQHVLHTHSARNLETYEVARPIITSPEP